MNNVILKNRVSTKDQRIEDCNNKELPISIKSIEHFSTYEFYNNILN